MANTRFQLEGNAAQLYEQYTVPTGARPSAELMLTQVPLQDAARVLDAACGTGIVTRLAAQQFGNITRIVGVDLNPTMLDVARAHTPMTDIPVEWWQGDLCALPFPAAHFDVVLCNHGLQFVPDKRTALQEIRRVLVFGGQLAFTTWSQVTPYSAALAEALRRHVSAKAAESCLAPYAFNDVETIRQLVSHAGFRAIVVQEMGFMRRLPATANAVIEFTGRSPNARDVAAVSEEARQAIGQEVCTALHAYQEGDYFVDPMHMHLVHACAA
jgi:ubiquinone/menaquinone biosynthesis C-methylase UbiE